MLSQPLKRRKNPSEAGPSDSHGMYGSKLSINGGTPRSRQNTGRSVSNVSSASATPTGEEDEEGHPKRSTRGRNPLPPSSGPLFPPLPPKQPKPKVQTSTSSTSLTTSNPPERAESPTNSEKPDVPTTSNASLTPPPPGSEGAVAPDDVDEEHGGLKPALEIDDKAIDGQIKEEAADVEDAAEVDRTPRQRTLSSTRAKRRRGEEALLLDDHLLPPELRRSGLPHKRGDHKDRDQQNDQDADQAKEEEGEDEVNDEPEEDNEEVIDDEGEEGQDITRCVCQRDDTDEMMIQCDKCNVWQHGPCMGIWADEEAPDEYFCELCHPELHGPLKRWMRHCGRNPALYQPPRPGDLKRLSVPNTKTPPSQSKRWTDPELMSPPPAPVVTKSGARSHHKKEVASPVDSSGEGQRPPRRPPIAATSGSANGRSQGKPKSVADEKEEKPVKPSSSSGRLSGKRQSSIGGGHKDSVSPGRSLSPSATLHHAARRRITMNSRDSMYEEEVRAAMEASRREALGLPPVEVETPEEAVEEEEFDKDKKESKKGKRKRDDEGSMEPGSSGVAATGPSSSKIKHPNQYTYRPKPASTSQPTAAVSPARRGAGTPVPSIAPPQHDHGTRRAGAIANGAIAYPTLSASSVAALSWYLPEHLSAFSELLPTPQPVALDVRSQRTLPSISRNHYHNQRYGPFSETRDESGKLVLPDDPGMREPTGEAETHLEPPARVKYPVKRITVGEMRKRVRSILEYVSKVQGTDEKRLERNRALGIVVTPLPKKTTKATDGEAGGDGDVDEPQVDTDGDVAMDSTGETVDAPGAAEQPTDIAEPETAPVRSSTDLMEELTRDLLAFQETFAANGIVSPMPPPIPSFETPPSIPVLVPDVDLDDQHDDTGDGKIDNGADQASQAEPTSIGNEETTTPADVETAVTERLPEDQAVDVYRQGQVDQVISQPTGDEVHASQAIAETALESKTAMKEPVVQMTVPDHGQTNDEAVKTE